MLDAKKHLVKQQVMLDDDPQDNDLPKDPAAADGI